MDEDILIIIASTVTVLGGMSILLTGWWLWLKSKARRALPDDVAHLRRALEDVRIELDAVHRELSDGQQELHERLDFAERLLAQRQPEPLPPPSDERH